MAFIIIENKKYDFPSLFKTETFKTRDLYLTKRDGSVPDSTLDEIYLQIFDEKGTKVLEKSHNDGITIVSAVNWYVQIVLFDIAFNKGKYTYKLFTINSDNETEYNLYGVLDIKE